MKAVVQMMALRTLAHSGQAWTLATKMKTGRPGGFEACSIPSNCLLSMPYAAVLATRPLLTKDIGSIKIDINDLGKIFMEDRTMFVHLVIKRMQVDTLVGFAKAAV